MVIRCVPPPRRPRRGVGPVHKVMVGGKRPCLDRFNVTWVDTPTYNVLYSARDSSGLICARGTQIPPLQPKVRVTMFVARNSISRNWVALDPRFWVFVSPLVLACQEKRDLSIQALIIAEPRSPLEEPKGCKRPDARPPSRFVNKVLGPKKLHGTEHCTQNSDSRDNRRRPTEAERTPHVNSREERMRSRCGQQGPRLVPRQCPPPGNGWCTKPSCPLILIQKKRRFFLVLQISPFSIP